MQMTMFLNQQQQLHMTASLKQAIELLYFTQTELEEHLLSLAVDNPFIDLESLHGQRWSEPIATSLGEATIQQSPSLYDQLIRQISDLNLNEDERIVLDHLVFCIDANGYLTESLSTIADEFQVPLEHVTHCLCLLQSLEPAGVGARSLQECLLIQLHYIHRQEFAYFLVNYYFEEFTQRKWNIISRSLHVSLIDIQSAYDVILSLQPRPSFSTNAGPTEYTRPEATVCIENGTPVIYTHETILSKLKVNDDYLQLMLKHPESREFLKPFKNQLSWLQNSILYREKTIHAILHRIVELQKDFFCKGPQHLQPMILKDIAEQCHLHESTISRTTSNKYIQTPYGLYALKYFFSSGIDQKDNPMITSHQIKFKIEQIIHEENKGFPFSDEQLVNELNKEGVTVSRRTIAKYRKSLGIPASTMRKVYV
ncbi:RNA polymerase factor sigma-54 [Aureibacillus halotolerans]|uniref:RNA polymerase RpoN-/SigL-like sigma 54 subunit n=1 Tax=Aureibacillus halotolerans TaxID=1508390 RepID=A0A4R6TQK8_9BACI|nr:RNA polymerase factor sigma-54 [Aureibacillus halotolerans]TDQ33734.1 RNA polymerase RpoN-/SigL-like sigma 54 subunit [Aureibacillus halotolerans]